MYRVLSCSLLLALAGLFAFVHSAAPPPAVSPRVQAIRALPLIDRMYATIDFPGIDDPKTTLGEALEALLKEYDLQIDVTEQGFKFEGLNDVLKTELCANNPVPPMKARLAVVLERILRRVVTLSGAVWLLREDHIEITTGYFADAESKGKTRLETGPEEDVLFILPQPLVNADFRKTPLSEALRLVADRTIWNIVLDESVAKEHGRRPVTARLRNAPLDTAVLLLASQADLGMAKLDNIYHVTTEEKAAALAKRAAQMRPAPPKRPAKKKQPSGMGLLHGLLPGSATEKKK